MIASDFKRYIQIFSSNDDLYLRMRHMNVPRAEKRKFISYDKVMVNIDVGFSS